MMSTTTKAKALRKFKDAGTGGSYAADQVIENLTPGQLANYVAAGLVEPVAASAKAESESKKA
jgi:hypothetical protein